MPYDQSSTLIHAILKHISNNCTFLTCNPPLATVFTFGDCSIYVKAFNASTRCTSIVLRLASRFDDYYIFNTTVWDPDYTQTEGPTFNLEEPGSLEKISDFITNYTKEYICACQLIAAKKPKPSRKSK